MKRFDDLRQGVREIVSMPVTALDLGSELRGVEEIIHITRAASAELEQRLCQHAWERTKRHTTG